MSDIEKRLSKAGLMAGGHAEKSIVKRLNITKKPRKTKKG